MAQDRPLSAVLTAVRKRAGWTQQNLADEAGCSRSLIASIEGGQKPTTEVLKRIILALPETSRAPVQESFEARQILAQSDLPGKERGNVEEDDLIDHWLNFQRVQHSTVRKWQKPRTANDTLHW
jgi:transcriptional regulator with XRE-family HTH domain